MKVTLLYRKRRLVVEVKENDTVGHLKAFFRDQYSLNLKSAGESEDMILTILYAGSQLKDDWIISDIGILPGSVLQCSLQSRDKIFLRAYVAFNKKTYDFTRPMSVEETTVVEFKRMIQEVSGIPVTVMRLCTMPSGVELLNGRTLEEYDIMIGDTIHVDIWDGMADFLLSVFAGDVTATMDALVNPADDPALHKYQLRVALCIASFYGFIQLVSQLLKSGARCDEPVGEHPARSWCSNSVAHPLSLQTPTHAAAQTGKITCIRLFIHHNPACILPKDGYGRTPTGVARMYGQRECFKLLITEQFRKQQYNGLSLSMYSKVRKWCERARDRVAYYRSDPNFPVLLATLDKTGHSAVVGSPIQMNGFGENIQSSANKLNRAKIDAKTQWLWPRREEINSMVKVADDVKPPKKLYKKLPIIRKQTSPRAKNLVKRSSSFESAADSKGPAKKVNGDRVLISKPHLKSKIASQFNSSICNENEPNGKNALYSNNQCICGDNVRCSCGGESRFPGINTGKPRRSSSPASFFITEDVRHDNVVIQKLSKPELNARKSVKPTLQPHVTQRAVKDESRALTAQAHSVIQQATGQNSRALARSSLEVCETFTAVGWLRRLHLATNYNRKTLLRGMRDKGQHLTADSSLK